MASERDQAGQAGSGMSGTGRDNAGNSSAMGDKGGSAEVHSGLHSAGGGDQYVGLQFAGSEEGGGRSRLGGAADAIRDRVGEGARNLAGEVGPRVARVASTTRERANRVMEQRGLVDRLRDNPLPILGVAFAIGFVLAARDDDDDYGSSKASRARRELRGALMGGISAGIAQGARGFLSQTNNQGSGFLAELIDGFMGSQGGSPGGSTTRASGTGGSGAGSSGARTGGSTGSASAGGSTASGGGARSSAGASRAGTSGSGAGSTGGSRPPSHQENS